MHYLSLTTFKFFMIIFILPLLKSCDDKKINYKEEHLYTSDSLHNYFNINQNNLESSIFYRINQFLELEESPSLNVDLEIRVLSSKDFDDYFYYRFYLKDGVWEGKIYIMEYLTYKIKKSNSFTPVKGWESFEKYLIHSNILNIKNFESPQNYLHPRVFDIQIVTRSFMKVVSLKDFYNAGGTNYVNVQSFFKAILGDNFIEELDSQ